MNRKEIIEEIEFLFENEPDEYYELINDLEEKFNFYVDTSNYYETE